jgi:hypothetical protein
MPAHLRTEAYPVYRGHRYPPTEARATGDTTLSYERNNELIDKAKNALGE